MTDVDVADQLKGDVYRMVNEWGTGSGGGQCFSGRLEHCWPIDTNFIWGCVEKTEIPQTVQRAVCIQMCHCRALDLS